MICINISQELCICMEQRKKKIKAGEEEGEVFRCSQSVFLTVHGKSAGKMIMKNRVERINISLIFDRLAN